MGMREDGKDYIVKIDWDARKVILTDGERIIFDEDIKVASVKNDDKVGLSFDEDLLPIYEMSYERRFFILLPKAIICNTADLNRTYVLKPMSSENYTTDLNQLIGLITKYNNNDNTSLTVNVKGVKFNMIYVDGGTFMMGATKEQIERGHVLENEFPAHEVTLDSYYIGQTEVTNELWVAVMGYIPSRQVVKDQPVEQVTWETCQQFIKKLNEMTGLKFRLPTEAEWEFAARGGNKSAGYLYAGGDRIEDVGWYQRNSGKRVRHPANKKPNELFLFDMSGNVQEWVEDYMGEYPSEPQTNPRGPETGELRITRGGAVRTTDWACRVSCRRQLPATYKFDDIGFRLAL